jgi:protein involved in polysaccharide export with SLBB domain
MVTAPLTAQAADGTDPRLMLALSSADYPATPGDVYILAYYVAGLGGGISSPLTLDAGYQLKVQNMGTLNARGKTYLQLRNEVIDLVSRNYPMSGASLTLTHLGRFNVVVTGETLSPGARVVDGLTRVSDLATNLTDKGSIRFVQVTAANGNIQVYDSFKASRLGNLSQNPYIKPGERVTIPDAGRIVQVNGEVFRPGKYELLAGEHLLELIEQYGGGFTLEAAPEKLTINRIDSNVLASRNWSLHSWYTDRGVFLVHGDIVTVPNRSVNREAVFFEGAVFFISENDTLTRSRDETTKVVSRIPYYFYPGETIGNASRNNRQYFTEVSDLTNAYILRGGLRIPIDLERMLYRNSNRGDIMLRGGDVIVVPYRQYYSITGEIADAGDKPLSTLTRLSTLLTNLTSKASTRRVRVTSAAGTTATYDLFQSHRFGDLTQDPYIRPGDKIHVPVAERHVTIDGEVFRPGRYELLPGESLKELVEYYGDGFTLDAAPERISLTRAGADISVSREIQFFVWDQDTAIAISLADGDHVTVANRNTNRQAVFFEGAVFFISENDTLTRDRDETTKAVSRIPYYFYPGETIGNASRNSRQYFTEVSDLTKVYILRGETKIGVDLERILYRNDNAADLILEAGDVIVIPYRQYYAITGEVSDAGDKPLNTLTRLSSLLTNLTSKASTRRVMVTSAAGAIATYDMFQASRFGDEDQNPYIRPGDKIHVPVAERHVTIDGEVFRPGRYELLPGESLRELVEYYGDGFTLDAAPDKISLTRAGTDTSVSRDIRYLVWEKDAGIPLVDGDRITVTNRSANRQAVFFEGAVFFISENETLTRERDETTKAVSRIPYYFSPGETLANASRNSRQYFTEVSDLTKTYILRGETRIGVDLERMLYQNDNSADMSLQAGDVIVIPYRQYYTIAGEITDAGERPLNTLTRLSALLTNLTLKASTRQVQVTSATGSTTTYDLFQAQRFGDLSQNPYIRPGDHIHVPAAERVVTVNGEVFRPGTYELLPAESLKELVEYYGDGFTWNADPERLRLSRVSTPQGIAGESFLFAYEEYADMVLENRDVIIIGNKTLNRPVAFFEGAISRPTGAVEQTTTEIEGTSVLEYPFYMGETLGTTVRAIRERFTVSSDLGNAYIIREGQKKNIPVDLRQFIYYNDFSKDIGMENGDRVIIPFLQYFVLVSGAVKSPGRYPYVPDRKLDYYINLAGGRDELLNNGLGLRVYDLDNKRLSVSENIPPESMITVPVNKVSAKFSQWGPIITTILSIVSTTLSILAISGVF